MRNALALGLLVLAACYRQAPPPEAPAAPPETTPYETEPMEPMEPADEPATTGQAPWGSMEDLPEEIPEIRAGGTCILDSDCVVAEAIAGLDHVPDPEMETCGSECFVAIRADQLEAWQEAKDMLEDEVPCELPQVECPPSYEYEARCIQARCAVIPAIEEPMPL